MSGPPIQASSEPFGPTYAQQYDLLYEDKDYSAECDRLEAIFQRHAARPIKDVLDLGCGTGNHSLRLAARGYDVVGVDRSHEMLAQAEQKASALRGDACLGSIAFEAGDVRCVRLGCQFDVVLLMFAVLGYQTTNQDVLATLHTARQHLRPGGLVVFDVWYGPAVLTTRPTERVKVIHTDEGQLIRSARAELDVRSQTCSVSYRLWRLSSRRTVTEAQETHTMRYFFPMELELYLSEAGFDLTELSSWEETDRPADETTWNVVVAAVAN